MQGMIFAAGEGRRLRPLTLSTPKALVDIGGRTMLERAIERMEQAGCRRIVVNVCHLGSQVVEALGKMHAKAEILISDERATGLLDTGGGLLKARELFDPGDDAILLHNVDILTDYPLSELKLHGDAAALAVWPRQSSRQLYFAHGLLSGWQNKTTGESRPLAFAPAQGMEEVAFGGIQLVSTRIFDRLEGYASVHGPKFSIIPFYLDNLAGLRVHRGPGITPSLWHDIGSPEKLEAARAAFR